jgi:hypothetical protein
VRLRNNKIQIFYEKPFKVKEKIIHYVSSMYYFLLLEIKALKHNCLKLINKLKYILVFYIFYFPEFSLYPKKRYQ